MPKRHFIFPKSAAGTVAAFIAANRETLASPETQAALSAASTEVRELAAERRDVRIISPEMCNAPVVV